MIKKISLALLMLCGTLFATAQQQQLSSKDMVGITPMIPGGLNMPEDAKKSLGVKLGQLVTQNGFGSNSSQFVLTANVVTVDKQATATAPPQFLIKYEVAVYLLDVAEGVVIDEMSFNVTGVDRLENKAMINAINQIKPKSPETAAWMNGCREKIITYYNTRIPALLTKAKSLADRNEYEEAISVLSGIPESVDQYPKVAEAMTAIYIKMIDRDALALIQEAKGLITVKKYEEAFEVLANVDPSSTHFKQASGMVDQVRQQFAAAANAAWAQKLKEYDDKKEAAQRLHDDRVMLTKMNIEAAQKVGTEAAKSSNSSVAASVTKWFMGKFR